MLAKLTRRLALACALVAGCGGGSSGDAPSPDESCSRLVTVKSCCEQAKAGCGWLSAGNDGLGNACALAGAKCSADAECGDGYVCSKRMTKGCSVVILPEEPTEGVCVRKSSVIYRPPPGGWCDPEKGPVATEGGRATLCPNGMLCAQFVAAVDWQCCDPRTTDLCAP